ncbi:MAG: 5-formyltetrahydrofolate cyclo-ligase [Nonlabens sp.]|nr:5-formyltetrahydrofolate cyclo-ligase [Nonlabens sp.]
MQKARLRKLYKEKRAALSQGQIDDYSIAIANNCLKLDIWDKQTFHLFLTIDKLMEVQTQYLLSILQGKDKNVVISKSDFDSHSMRHYLLTDQTKLAINEYGIPEPVDGIEMKESQLEVVFVPLLCVDKSGNRVGYGKGFYDKFLEKCGSDTLRVGLSFFEPITEQINVLSTDVPLHAVVTPCKLLKF